MGKELYRVRKSWDDVKSQVGAYTILENAKKACNNAGSEYEVYNSKGECIYPIKITESVSSVVDTSAADPAKMWSFFKSKGLSDYGVAGLMGNLYAESGLRACNLQNGFETSLGMNDSEYTIAVDNGSYKNFVNDNAGYGLAQWTHQTLKEQMLKFHQKKNKSIGDLDTQMEFLVHQLSTGFKTVWNTLKTAKSVRVASNVVLLQFERPVDQSSAVQEKRASYGQTYFDMFGKKEIVITTSKIEEPKEEVYKPQMDLQVSSNSTLMTVKGIYFDITNVDHKQSNANAWIGKTDKVETIQVKAWNQKISETGWILVEIQQNAENNELFAEMSKLTTYLCDKFNINPKGKVDSKFAVGGSADLEAWLEKFGKSLDSLRTDAAKSLGTTASQITPIIPDEPEIEVELYRVRKDWENAKSQIGAYSDFENAKKACDSAGKDYEVYNNKGIAIYPRESAEGNVSTEEFPIGSEVLLKPGSTYFDGKDIPDWVYQKKLYVRNKLSDGGVVISTKNKGAITGVVREKDLMEYIEPIIEEKQIIKFTPYLIKVAVDGLNVRSGPSTKYRINTQISKNQVYTIVNEKNGWGKLKSGAGWIALQYVRKI